MNQIENLTDNCDGYTQVSPDDLEQFKNIYFYKEKDGEILFPFIYKSLNEGILPSKCIIMIKKNEIIKKENEIKELISF